MKVKYIKKTFEIEEKLLHKFKVFAACNDKKQRELMNEIIELFFKDKSFIVTTNK